VSSSAETLLFVPLALGNAFAFELGVPEPAPEAVTAVAL
jgi:hypothetical protein